METHGLVCGSSSCRSRLPAVEICGDGDSKDRGNVRDK